MADVITIGGIEISRRAALAPMASVADRAYRLMCKNFGASYLVSEMISAKGLVYGDKKTAELCRITAEERPMALQLFGSEPEYMARAAEMLAKFEPDIIDINMGCPVPKVVQTGAGSALMKNPETAFLVTEAAVKHAPCPVTVKIRAGWDNESVNAPELAKRLEQAGAAAIAVHGRTRTQYYSGKADREIIRKVKEAVSCPVIGNGDVFTPQDCKAMYDETGCDLVMIGRGSCGRPWVFKETEHFIKTGELLPEPTLEEKMKIMLEHARLACSFKGERQGVKKMRHNIIWYVKGMPGAARFRAAAGELFTLADIESMAEKILQTSR